MDLYRGQFDFQNFSTQVHDFDPGINPWPGGLFWTLPVGAIGPVSLGTGTATMRAENLPVHDFFSIPNALFNGHSAPAVVSFDISWNGPVSDRGGVTTPGSTGELVMTDATMTWSASNNEGFSFTSDPSTTSFFAQLGHVSNGVFA